MCINGKHKFYISSCHNYNNNNNYYERFVFVKINILPKLLHKRLYAIYLHKFICTVIYLIITAV